MKTTCPTLLALSLLLPPFSAAGEAYLAWSDAAAGGKAIHLSRTAGGEGWESVPFDGGDGFAANYLPCVAVDSGGNPWIVWAAQKDDADAQIYFSRREGDGFTPPRRASGGEGWESNPALAFDGEGVPWIAFSRLAGASSEIFCSRFDGKGFSGETMVSSPDDSPDAKPALGTDAGGALLAAWQGWDGSRTRIYERRRAEGAWGETAIASAPGANAILPSVVRAADGKASVLWAGAAGSLEGLLPPPPLPSAELAARGAWCARRDDSGAWDNRRWQAAAAADEAPPAAGAAGYHDYTGYGDSITWGTVNKGDSYIPLLDAMLEKAYPGNLYTIWNAGYPGARTYHLLNGDPYVHHCPGIDSILARYPSTMILLMAGTNDIADGDDYADIRWNLGEMIDRSRAQGVEPILATIIPRFDTEVCRQRSRALSVSYIRPLAAAKAVRLADPWQKMVDYGDYSKLYISDHIHPRYPAGCQRVADAWFAAVPAGPVTPLDRILKWSRDWATDL